jgi:hypothetical protein
MLGETGRGFVKVRGATDAAMVVWQTTKMWLDCAEETLELAAAELGPLL